MNEEHFTFHLQYKYPDRFANRKYEQLSYPKNPKMCDPILVTLLKMQPHYSQSSRENATPSSGTSPLASYKEVPPREFKTRHVRESKTVLDSGFQTVDSRLEVQGPGFFVNDSGFLQLYSGFQSQNSGLHKQKFSDSGFPHMGRKWKIQAILIHLPCISKF